MIKRNAAQGPSFRGMTDLRRPEDRAKGPSIAELESAQIFVSTNTLKNLACQRIQSQSPFVLRN